MLRTVKRSEAFKTTGCAVTYISGVTEMYGTCPPSCPLNPEPSKSTNTIDKNYLKLLLRTIPRGGKAFAYTHFAIERITDTKIVSLLRKKTTATLNRSTDTIKEAIKMFTKYKLPTTVTLPEGQYTNKFYKIQNIPFVRCIAEYNKDYSCIDCKWCSIKDRKFIVFFTAHGPKKKLVGSKKAGGCYGSTGKVAMHWRTTKDMKVDNEEEHLYNFVKQLPTGTLLRHHIVGDIGRRNK